MSITYMGQAVENITFRGEQLELFRYKGRRVWTRPRSGSLLYLTLTSNLSITLSFTQSVANGISIDWGDGSEPQTVSGTSVSQAHSYEEAGDYIVSLTSVDGATWQPGGVLYNILGREGGGKGDTSPELTAVVLTEDVTGLGSYAFDACTSLTGITLPGTVTAVNSYAFYGCTGLKRVTIPDGVTTIATYAFYGCTALEKVVLPESLTSFGTYAFNNCEVLSEINFPSALSSIGSYAFSGCVALPENLELGAATIDNASFAACTQLKNVWLRSTVTTIKVYNVISNSVVTAHRGPFQNCVESLVLHCEPASRPEGWSEFFDVYTGTETRLATRYGVTAKPW